MSEYSITNQVNLGLNYPNLGVRSLGVNNNDPFNQINPLLHQQGGALNVEKTNLDGLASDSYGYIDLPNFNVKPDDATSPILEQAVREAHDVLTGLPNNENVNDIINQSFGEHWDKDAFNELRQDLLTQNYAKFPEIKVVPSAQIDHAKAAFAQKTNTIYVADNFLTENANNLDAVKGVILEEEGHYIDSRINEKDTPGDEGEIFSSLLQGSPVMPETFSEDDSATIFIDNEFLEIEQASYDRTAAVNYARKYAKNYGPNTGYGTSYPGTEGGGGDCANFVSKSLIAGGLLSQPIPGVINLVDTLEKRGIASRVNSINDLKLGDVITYNIRTNGTPYDHTAIYLGNGKVAAHTTDRLDYGWTLDLDQKKNDIRFFRINDGSGGGSTREFQTFIGYTDSNPDTRSISGINVRSGPGSNYSLLGKRGINQSVNFVEIERSGTNHYDYLSKQYNDDWYRISGTSNQWVSGAHITTPLEISQRGRYG
ncbi:amidase domain-containing protein [Limnoraphis robusta]|uniref:Amidase domain-containing protein n=1 Tax=Limnoraphis robusta CCNP1315 TaxID=3110306 RepID=A0ABU5U7P7_9CYAN|nr:amidase domain-containing protein [Limnoraphis robusta]MEA5522891.1 amidase domain-containing protein [Limnoraphis robusta CCNP1315]MEA5546847.1 amidase domain-containing protein [Limnoraphis robusta CCNP1324]